jgi:hypothetical protein
MKDGLQNLASTIMKIKSFTSEVGWAFFTTLNPDISIDSSILLVGVASRQRIGLQCHLFDRVSRSLRFDLIATTQANRG